MREAEIPALCYEQDAGESQNEHQGKNALS